MRFYTLRIRPLVGNSITIKHAPGEAYDNDIQGWIMERNKWLDVTAIDGKWYFIQRDSIAYIEVLEVSDE